MSSFGESAPGPQLMKEFGFTVENVVDAIEDVISANDTRWYQRARKDRASFDASNNREKTRALPDVGGSNELADAETVAHLLKYDSTHGRFDSSVDVSDGAISIAGKAISLTHEAAFGHDVWAKENVGLVIDCTGEDLDRTSAARHLGGSVERVLLSQPASADVDATIIWGLNQQALTQTWPLSLRGRAPAMP